MAFQEPDLSLLKCFLCYIASLIKRHRVEISTNTYTSTSEVLKYFTIFM